MSEQQREVIWQGRLDGFGTLRIVRVTTSSMKYAAVPKSITYWVEREDQDALGMPMWITAGTFDWQTHSLSHALTAAVLTVLARTVSAQKSETYVA